MHKTVVLTESREIYCSSEFAADPKCLAQEAKVVHL